MDDRVDQNFHFMMYAVSEMLDNLEPMTKTFKLNAIRLGKLIKRQKLKSRETLEEKELNYYFRSLRQIYENWARHGHPNWSVDEKDLAPIFTIIFTRKEGTGDEDMENQLFKYKSKEVSKEEVEFEVFSTDLTMTDARNIIKHVMEKKGLTMKDVEELMKKE